MVGLPFDETIDVWSIGCLIYELLAGRQLFPILLGGEEYPNNTHLLMMHDVLGPLPKTIMDAWPRREDYFGPNGTKLRPKESLVYLYHQHPFGALILISPQEVKFFA